MLLTLYSHWTYIWTYTYLNYARSYNYCFGVYWSSFYSTSSCFPLKIYFLIQIVSIIILHIMYLSGNSHMYKCRGVLFMCALFEFNVVKETFFSKKYENYLKLEIYHTKWWWRKSSFGGWKQTLSFSDYNVLFVSVQISTNCSACAWEALSMP